MSLCLLGGCIINAKAEAWDQVHDHPCWGQDRKRLNHRVRCCFCSMRRGGAWFPEGTMRRSHPCLVTPGSVWFITLTDTFAALVRTSLASFVVRRKLSPIAGGGNSETVRCRRLLFLRTSICLEDDHVAICLLYGLLSCFFL